MATVLKIKRSTASGTSAPGSLAAGELAVTYGGGTSGNVGERLMIGNADGSAVRFSASERKTNIEMSYRTQFDRVMKDF